MFKKSKLICKRAGRFYDNKCAALSAALVASPLAAFAESVGFSGSTLDSVEWPWEKFLNSIAKELTGPLPVTLGILGIAVGAIGMFMGNHGAGMQKMLVLIFAVSICLFAPTFISYISQSAGGATIFGM